MGDPAGVGPEVLLKSYKKARERQNLVAISDFDKIKHLADRCSVPLKKIYNIDDAENFKDQLNILNIKYPADFVPGKFDYKNTKSVLDSIRIATELCMKNKVNAMVTGPINKSILKSYQEFKFAGHTDYIEFLCGCKKDTATMMMLNRYLKIIPLTIHEPLNQVSSKLKH